MAEHLKAIQELQALSPDLHIFCPRTSTDSRKPSAFEADEKGRQQLKDAKARQDKYFSALPLLAYDGPECEPHHNWLYDTLDQQLGKCELCVKNYYIGKIEFTQTLLQEYDQSEVKQFLEILNRRDIARIEKGLDHAARILEAAQPQQRAASILPVEHLFALFEALHCEPFLDDEERLRIHFNKPFKLVQTKKPLRVNDLLPATTKFLFSTNQDRLTWAAGSWEKFGATISDEEWDWAVKNTLQKEFAIIKDEQGLIRAWSALKVITDKLSAEQIKLKLFDLNFKVSKRALENLAQHATMAIPQILACMQTIWSRAPEAYWHEMSTVSSATVVETIFNTANFDRCLQQQIHTDSGAEKCSLLSWIPIFMTGLPIGACPLGARTIAYQLSKRIDSDKAPPDMRKICFTVKLETLLSMVMRYTSDEPNLPNIARPTIINVVQTSAENLESILSFKPSTPWDQSSKIEEKIRTLVKNTLWLECRTLKFDWDSLHTTNPRTKNCSYTPDLWRISRTYMRPDSFDFSAAVLQGTVVPLTGLEAFVIKEKRVEHQQEKESFNDIFAKIEASMAANIQTIAEFPHAHLDNLFANQHTNMALMSLLFSGNEQIYFAVIELVKNVSDEPARREALSHVLQAFLRETLYSICWVFRRVTNSMVFAPIPRLLKTAKDILDLLCESNGILRDRALVQKSAGAIKNYWSYNWIMLQMIFRRTEKWSVEVKDNVLLTEVCRDTMQYAQELFNQYSLFAQILQQANPNLTPEDAAKELLTVGEKDVGSPPKTLDVMVKWLRLRDPYLAETLVNLITKLLPKLKDYGTKLSDDAFCLSYLEQVVTVGPDGKGVRTILDPNQKAQLVRALEQYIGRQIISKQISVRTKQQKLEFANKGGSSLSRNVIKIDDDEIDIKREHTEDTRLARKLQHLDDKYALHPQQKSGSLPTSKLKPSVQSLKEIAAKQSAGSKAFLEKRRAEELAAQVKRKELAAKIRAGMSGDTANAGSGLAGLGLLGKDHTVPKSDLMMSSESEDSSSSDEDELFGTKAKAVKAGGIQGSTMPVPTRKVKIVRSAKDMRARLQPNLSSLHKTILGWDFFAETDTPPNSGKDDYTLVTSTFKAVEDYIKTFEPLLILEGWQSFRTAREEENLKPFEIKVANSLIVDSFLEINTEISINEGKELNLGVAEVVLFSKGGRPHAEPQEPHCLARIKEITRKKGQMQIVYQINSAGNPMRAHLNDGATIWGVAITSLTPLEREYGALKALPYYDLCDEIIRAKPSPLLQYGDAEVRSLEQVYNVNTAQAKAVKSAVDNDAFTLIQGPPGSGKTKTICAILGAIMTVLLGSGISRPTVNGKAAPPPMNKKVLVAAPSNAAVDELVMRFKDGIKLTDGTPQELNVVRLGRSDAINAAVKDVTLEELVNARLNQDVSGRGPQDDIHPIMMEHKNVCVQLNKLKDEMMTQRAKGEQVPVQQETIHDQLRQKKNILSAKIDGMREKQQNANRDADINRKKAQQEILDSAHVLCATLSGSGHEIFQGLNVEFETVIIDEAAQSIELSALIPLKYGCTKCILVGDPKQLPPTVLSRQAAKYQYEQSLFARMEGNHPKHIHLLDTQYRMHPDISAFPSKTFYDGRLKDGGDMAKLRARPWHKSALLSPYRFFDVQGMSESAPKGRSLVNKAEIEVALQIYDRLTSDLSKYDFNGKIGIITPYKGQLKALKQQFGYRYGQNITSLIEFNTTDAFQGREAEIIIFSCVRASTQGIGFLKDIRRMNVGLTRAKCSLWVLGNTQALRQGEFWNAMIEDAKRRSLFTEGNVVSLFKRPLLTKEMLRDDEVMSGVNGDLALPITKQDSDTLAKTNVGESRPSSSSSGGFRSIPIGPKAIKRDTPSGSSSGRSSPSVRPGMQAQSHTVNKNTPATLSSKIVPEGRIDSSATNSLSTSNVRGDTITSNKKLDLERRLDIPERSQIRQQEMSFDTCRVEQRVKKAERQLGEHDASSPNVRTTLPAATNANGHKTNGASGEAVKRKRDVLETSEKSDPAVRTPTVGMHSQIRVPGATGQQSAPPTKLIKKKKTNADSMFATKR